MHRQREQGEDGRADGDQHRPEPHDAGVDEREPERLTLRSLPNRLISLLLKVLPPGVDLPDASLEDDEFVNVVAQNLPMPEDDRQGLLERSSVLARARALIDGLGK